MLRSSQVLLKSSLRIIRETGIGCLCEYEHVCGEVTGAAGLRLRDDIPHMSWSLGPRPG